MITDNDLLRYKRVPINVAASYLGVSNRTLMKGLREDKFPFGTAIKHASEWSYVIPPARLIAWVTGSDITATHKGEHSSYE